jgi:hypothetical protein
MARRAPDGSPIHWMDYLVIGIGAAAGLGLLISGLGSPSAGLDAQGEAFLAAASRLGLGLVFAVVIVRYFDLLLEWLRRDRKAREDLAAARRDAEYLRSKADGPAP